MINQLLNSRKQKIFVICMIVVFGTGFYHGLIVPLQKRTSSLQEEITFEKKHLDRSQMVIQNSEKLNARYDGYRKYFSRSGTEEEVTSSILSEIEKVSQKLELYVMELKPQEVKHNDFEDQFSVRLTINSEFTNIVHFLYTLQQSPYLFDVEEVEIMKSVKRNQGAVTTRLVLGKTYILTDVDPNSDLEKNLKKKIERVL